jgi:hypothetical protein
MTKRVRYTKNKTDITSDYYLLNNTPIRVRIIPVPNMVFWIEYVDGDILYSAHCYSIRMCKQKAKTILKELGVTFEEEVRLNGAILKPR